MQLGAVDYIRKPIHMDSLTARIEIHAELLRIQQALEQKLHEQGLTVETIFNQAPIGIAVSHNYETLTEEQNRYFNVNPMFEKISGRNKEELLRLGWAGITHPDDLEEDVENYKRLKAGEIESYAMDKRLIKPDGSVVWVHMIVASSACPMSINITMSAWFRISPNAKPLKRHYKRASAEIRASFPPSRTGIQVQL